MGPGAGWVVDIANPVEQNANLNFRYMRLRMSTADSNNIAVGNLLL